MVRLVSSELAANDGLHQLSSLDTLIPQKTWDSFVWDDEHKDADHFDSAQCKLAEASKTMNVIHLKTKGVVFVLRTNDTRHPERSPHFVRTSRGMIRPV